MSKTLNVELLGFPVVINNVPETLDEAVTACGGGAVGEQKLVTKFVGFANAHSTYGDGRSEVLDAVEKATGIAQKTNADGDTDEKDSVYVARALAESGKTPADVLSTVEGGVLAVDFNAGGNRRPGGAKAPAKTYVDNATKCITTMTPETLTGFVTGLQGLNPGLVIALDESGKPTVDSLAAALKANNDRKNAEAKAELAALGATV